MAEGHVTARCSGPRVRGLACALCVIGLVAAAGVVASSGRAAGIAGTEVAGAPLRKIAEFELPGPPGKRFDYLTIDEDDNYLLSAHLGAGLLHVIDLKTNAVVKTVRDVPGVEGVAYIAEGRKVYTANWGENKDWRRRSGAHERHQETSDGREA